MTLTAARTRALAKCDRVRVAPPRIRIKSARVSCMARFVVVDARVAQLRAALRGWAPDVAVVGANFHAEFTAERAVIVARRDAMTTGPRWRLADVLRLENVVAVDAVMLLEADARAINETLATTGGAVVEARGRVPALVEDFNVLTERATEAAMRRGYQPHAGRD